MPKQPRPKKKRSGKGKLTSFFRGVARVSQLTVQDFRRKSREKKTLKRASPPRLRDWVAKGAKRGTLAALLTLSPAVLAGAIPPETLLLVLPLYGTLPGAAAGAGAKGIHSYFSIRNAKKNEVPRHAQRMSEALKLTRANPSLAEPLAYAWDPVNPEFAHYLRGYEEKFGKETESK